MRKFYIIVFSVLIFSTNAARAQSPGTHLSYDGAFNYLTMPPDIVKNLNGSFTIEAYVYWRGGSPWWSNSLLWHRIFDFGTDQHNYAFLVPQSNYNSRSGAMFAITLPGTPSDVSQVIQSDNPLPQNVWTHIAVTLDATTNTGNLYINGVLDPTATTTGFTFRLSDLGSTPNDWLGKSEFAGSPSFDPYFNGDIDEFRISDVVRYTSTFTPPIFEFTTDPNTVALYHFDEGSGQLTSDASGNFPQAILGTDVSVDPTTDPTWALFSPLPVRLIDFTATANQANRTVDIKWSAGIDAPTEFVLERSSNGTNFSPVYNLTRSLGTTGTESFLYRDLNPANGRSYYRLKCTEIGSPSVYSRILPVSFGSRQSFVIYPNPVKGSGINLELVQPFTGNIEFRMYNSAGATVYRKNSTVVREKEFHIDGTTGLPSGTYIIEIKMNGQKQSRPVVIE
ncbi:MAG: LamG-like jellyroll fold domain-containing protein [Flavisolibacter sp.]|jgi:hypothetical protein